ncbi:SDR family oxidoreductase [Mycobacterium sp. BMJ-28]
MRYLLNRSTPLGRGRVLLVTGAASGIGAATARMATARGFRVAIADINQAATNQLTAELGPTTLAVGLDVRDPDQWTRALALTREQFGQLDVLINNAGIIHTGHVRDVTIAQHQAMIDVNYMGAITGLKTVLPLFRNQGHGHVINVCSMTSFMPMSGYATYGATKHAMRSFHHSTAIEERDSPVTFSIIHPPSVQTPMLEQEMADKTSALAFAEKPTSPEAIARAILRAIDDKPVEVVFPPVMGRVQRALGAHATLMRRIIPLAEASGLRRRTKLQRIRP